MTLPFPVLDDRSYDQLLAELKARIPVYTPEWTDLGPSDPGITLLELVAHVGEILLYRFNQIPDQTRLWLLHLLQVSPYPAQPAVGLVAFTASAPGGSGLTWPQVPLDSTVTAGAVPFRVLDDVLVLPLTATAVIKAVGELPADELLREEFRRVREAAGIDESRAVPFQELVLRSAPASPGEDLLDVSSAVDRSLWVALQAPEGATGSPQEQLAALVDPQGPLARDPFVLGVGADTEHPAPLAGTVLAGEEPTTPGPGLVWQVSTTTEGEYLPLSVVRDTTDGLRRTGVVALRLPAADLSRLGVPELDDTDLAGVAERPPALAGRPAPLLWLRAFPRQGALDLGRLRWVGMNGAGVEQVAQAAPELIGTGQGLSHQVLSLANAPVVPGSLQVEVLENDGWQPWQVVQSMAGSRPDDRHLLADLGSGRLQCGDSVRGRVLPVGAPVRATAYRYGGGSAGNLPAGGITGVPVPGVSVTNPLPTAGGQDGETISRALERIPGELTRHDRAVVADDFRELAMLPAVGRAECLPRFDPRSTRFDAAGVVTVMVWPAQDALHPDAPTADTPLLDAVRGTLDRRRLVTTELFVVPPVYRRIAVSVGIAVKTGHSVIGVRRWVEIVLRQYLSPLPPFGPDGGGWPLGHRVHGPELEAAVLQVEGVDYVEKLLLAELGGSGAGPVVTTIPLQAWEVPEPHDVSVVVGEPPPPGASAQTPLDPDGPAPVPVPVPREEC